MTLYEIKEQYDLAILNAVNPETGELDESVYAELDKIEEAIDDKAIAVACAVKNYKAHADAVAAEIKKLQAKKKSLENKADRLKQYLAFSITTGRKIAGGPASIGWRQSEAVLITGDVPGDYLKEPKPPEPDKTLIKKAIKDGFEVPGAELEKRKNLIIS